MRIGNQGVDSLGSGSVSSVGGASSDNRTSGSSSINKSDSVSLTNAANLIALAKAGSTSRQSQVQALAAQVRSGSYKTDTDQVSRSLVEGHLTA
jgi:anti-sigma28 factor (negative regulator of flagellin synthesis)